MMSDTDLLPEYSSQAPSGITPRTQLTTQHKATLNDKQGNAWLALRLHSRAHDAKNVPFFLSHDTIRGEAQLNLKKAEAIKGITVSVSLS